MSTYRCPECGSQSDLTAVYGSEIVSVYCLKHRSAGARSQIDPVRMEIIPEPISARLPELVPAG